jgi:hypothetical protein
LFCRRKRNILKGESKMKVFIVEGPTFEKFAYVSEKNAKKKFYELIGEQLFDIVAASPRDVFGTVIDSTDINKLMEEIAATDGDSFSMGGFEFDISEVEIEDFQPS